MPSIAARIVFALAIVVLLQALPATAQGPTIEPRFQEIMQLIDNGKYDAATSQALALVKTVKADDIESVGAVRAVIDALRARDQRKAADEIYQAAVSTFKATGQVAVVLGGGRADGTTLRRLRVVYRARKTRSVFNPSTDLKRIRVGNQASILKIMAPGNTGVQFMKGLDGVLWAPITDEHRSGIFGSLGITNLDATALDLMQIYPRVKEKLQVIALLGAIGSSPSQELTDSTRRRMLNFLVGRMNAEKDHALKRQSVLALALLSAIDMPTINAVVTYYSTNKNVWETFPVQQFFEYHSARLQRLANVAEIRARVQAVDCFYTANILKYL